MKNFIISKQHQQGESILKKNGNHPSQATSYIILFILQILFKML